MLKNSKYINDNIIIADEENTTKKYGKPAQVGYDLSVKSIYEISDAGFVSLFKSFVPEYKEIPSKITHYNKVEFDGWYLPKGNYILECNEGVQLGNNDTCYIIMRSSLNRVGATIHSAVWDPGFTTEDENKINTITIRLVVENENGFYLEKNSRVAQMICFENEDTVQYDGQYQGGRKTSKLTN